MDLFCVGDSGVVAFRDSPHFMQLWAQSSRYFSSSPESTASAAFLHNSLGSLQPVVLHRLEMCRQMS